MYSIGDIIVYGSAGVYVVKDITSLKGISCADKNKKYYVLKPYFGEGVVYYPVDGDKVFLRHIKTADEVNDIIDEIPSINHSAATDETLRELSEKYKASFDAHECTGLLSLVMSVYDKKKLCKEQKKKFGQLDEAFMKQAENLLFSEFGAALGIDKGEVQEYIKKRIEV